MPGDKKFTWYFPLYMEIKNRTVNYVLLKHITALFLFCLENSHFYICKIVNAFLFFQTRMERIYYKTK